jgi:thioredoxin reductase
MTDTQFYILVTVVGAGLTGIGAAIRFSANRLLKALDKNSDVMLKNTESNTVLTTKIDSIFSWMERRGTTPPTTKKRAATSPHGHKVIIPEKDNEDE